MSKIDKSNKRMDILVAAAKVFSEENFYQVKVQEIADAAGIGKGTIYEYFNSKEELFHEMLREGFKQYYQVVRIDPNDERSIWIKLEEFLKNNVYFVSENRQIAYLLLSNNHPFQQKLTSQIMEVRKSLLHDMEQTFQLAINEGEIEKKPIDLLARIFWGAFMEVVSSMILLEGNPPDDETIKEVIGTFKKGLEI
ncbi:TetR/AcrR family transcriptional regulator [Natranaerobius thermophilus]|uniref:Transcriptional regulator, TetR family n=1 Tax=Natranaerobius thermophilus (strain ATCC BAA-1301 / DSM 18059 / JW/NM-WN-LF) TaxID=457570 RepID=B2A6H9_NATTJ|nr:TetR/AcrR family transcriptional regulator [Natranaerobius thermophilus]ACB85512.1 transcriptional regulator, TetR family [Natranaerobius thermophilus JW/NM-WN-LF]